ncbi:MAG: HAMP domain-containing histidine kinase [Phycisphaerae bacterium]|nr:HAMP domain-containing histidine kinase [Phycisphaerae bacterium]
MSNQMRHLRVGLQPKAILVLTVVVLGAVGSGVWFYLTATRSLLERSDGQYAARTATSLGGLVREDIESGRVEAVGSVLEDFTQVSGLPYAAVVDAQGQLIARICNDGQRPLWDGRLLSLPVSVSSTDRWGDMLVVAQPVFVGREGNSPGRLVGAIRLVLNTEDTSAKLAGARRRLLIVAVAITGCTIPLGYLLVWRLVLQPIGRLVAVTRRLADGDLMARVGMRRNDEMGDLASAFDAMAEHVAQARRELLRANEQLERKVEQRTCELAEANRRLTQEAADKEEFLRAVSHDLNAPLRNIAGMASMTLLKDGDHLSGEVHQRLERIRANADAQTAMISDLLELSRIRTRPQKRQTVDIAELLAEQGQHFEFELDSGNTTLEITPPMPQLYVERNRICQVFQNLIDNAIKYMDKPSGGRIVITHRLDGDLHEFRVTDNGPGVPARQQREIFCIFRRAQTPQTAQVPGKGVGLAVVSTIASTYGGRAWVESQEGRGSSFCFTLSAELTAPPGARSGTRQGESGNGSPPRAAPVSAPFRTPRRGHKNSQAAGTGRATGDSNRTP